MSLVERIAILTCGRATVAAGANAAVASGLMLHLTTQIIALTVSTGSSTSQSIRLARTDIRTHPLT
jgi:hypothetical protein